MEQIIDLFQKPKLCNPSILSACIASEMSKAKICPRIIPSAGYRQYMVNGEMLLSNSSMANPATPIITNNNKLNISFAYNTKSLSAIFVNLVHNANKVWCSLTQFAFAIILQLITAFTIPKNQCLLLFGICLAPCSAMLGIITRVSISPSFITCKHLIPIGFVISSVLCNYMLKMSQPISMEIGPSRFKVLMWHRNIIT